MRGNDCRRDAVGHMRGRHLLAYHRRHRRHHHLVCTAAAAAAGCFATCMFYFLPGRLSHVALACKQLRVLCTAPALLEELDVSIQGSRTLARTRGLLRFLMRHCEHARSLGLSISIDEAGADRGEVAALVCACLATCAAPRGQPGGGLRQLSIGSDTPLASTSCLPLLTALEELSLPWRPSSFCLHLDDSWRQLTALRSAWLSGHLLCSQRGPALPPSLTWLRIEGDLGDHGVRWLDSRVSSVGRSVAELCKCAVPLSWWLAVCRLGHVLPACG